MLLENLDQPHEEEPTCNLSDLINAMDIGDVDECYKLLAADVFTQVEITTELVNNVADTPLLMNNGNSKMFIIQ